METVLAAWGAILSTFLAVRQIVEWQRDRPLLKVRATLARVPLSGDEEQRDPRMVCVTNEKGLAEGFYVGIGVANAGNRPVQVVSVVFGGSKYQHQVVPEGLPVVLEPRTRVDLQLQPEWVAFHNTDLLTLGVLDALGRAHLASSVERNALVASIDTLPTRVGRYKRKEGADPRMDEYVTAFQVHDQAVQVRVDDGNSGAS